MKLSYEEWYKIPRNRMYSVYNSMNRRCNNPKYYLYKDYGGRGIKCLWNSFEEFFKDMGVAPKGMSLERIDNNGPYCLENCRWATRKEQCSNRRSNVFIEYENETHTLFQWAEIKNIPPKTLWARIKTYRWTIEKSFNTKLIK